MRTAANRLKSVVARIVRPRHVNMYLISRQRLLSYGGAIVLLEAGERARLNCSSGTLQELRILVQVVYAQQSFTQHLVHLK
mmetsp:Transcript_6911/g.21023  ORF Transcript_6911/g.21023 Transcript_6911/m.21023 type:complete len:81 (+) Transcript_6911:1190-1432(+)